MSRRPSRRRAGLALLPNPATAAGVAKKEAPKRGPDPYWSSKGAWGQEERDQWGLEKIGWNPALVKRATASVIVAVIDTGIDYYHPDLPVDRIYTNPKEVLNGKDDDGNGYVDDLVGWNFVDAAETPSIPPATEPSWPGFWRRGSRTAKVSPAWCQACA